MSTSTRREFDFKFGPAMSVGLATEGSKVTGQVQVSFHSNTDANVQTTHDAVDSAPLMVGNAGPYWVNLTIRRRPDGEWVLSEQYVSRPGVDNRPVPLTHRAAIIAAAELAVADLATPSRLAEAEYANALREANRVMDDLRKAEAELARCRKALRPLVKIIDAYERPGE